MASSGDQSRISWNRKNRRKKRTEEEKQRKKQKKGKTIQVNKVAEE